MDEIQNISREINYNNLTYYFKDPGISPINFSKYRGPFSFFKKK